jgi:hypothetical protein
MSPSELRKTTFVGVVEDNNDPKKLGRCKCRVLNVFDDIASEDLPWASPWKDLNGNQFIVPDKGKVVSIVFDEGNIYKPEYICAEHYNANLEQKLQSLSGSNYTSMRALMFDHKTQIYSNDAEGLKMDYKFNNINITDTSININLKDNLGRVNLGSNLTTQQAVLGNNFFDWFDRFLAHLFEDGFLDTSGALLVPTPELFADLVEYQNSRITSRYLSNHVSIVDNNYVEQQTRIANGQIGDSWKSTVTNNTSASSESIDYGARDGQNTDNPTGTLSPSPSDTTDPAVGSNKNPPAAPATDNDDIDVIFKTMRKKNYIIYEKPYQMNIIGIRRQYEGMKYSNRFIDDCYLIYKDDKNSWKIHKYTITTMPGYYKGEERSGFVEKGESVFLPPNQKFSDGKIAQAKINNKSSKRFKARGGLGMLKPSQMVDTYIFGEYFGDALRTKGSQPVYRDTTTGDTITYSVGKDKPAFGGACYFHRAGENSVNVDNWSEGCQVFQNFDHWKHFMKLCKIHVEKNGNSFTYTLMEERDIEATRAEIRGLAT